MTNISVVVKCALANKDTVEGITLLDKNTWKSPGEGWLSVQYGHWIQNSFSGVILQQPGKGDIAHLTGLIFDSAVDGDSGELRYDLSGDAGTWVVVTTT